MVVGVGLLLLFVFLDLCCVELLDLCVCLVCRGVVVGVWCGGEVIFSWFIEFVIVVLVDSLFCVCGICLLFFGKDFFYYVICLLKCVSMWLRWLVCVSLLCWFCCVIWCLYLVCSEVGGLILKCM